MKESDYYRGSPHKPVRDGGKKHKETYEQLGLPIILPKKAKGPSTDVNDNKRKYA